MVSPHYGPFTKDAQGIDIGSGAEFHLVLKGSPEQIERLKTFLVDEVYGVLWCELKRMNATMRSTDGKTKPCGCHGPNQ